MKLNLLIDALHFFHHQIFPRWKTVEELMVVAIAMIGEVMLVANSHH